MYVIIGYLGLTLMLALYMGIVVLFWQWIASIKVPRKHFMAIVIIAGVVLVIINESTYKERGAIMAPETYWTLAMSIVVPYLVVWTVVCKIRGRHFQKNGLLSKGNLTDD